MASERVATVLVAVKGVEEKSPDEEVMYHTLLVQSANAVPEAHDSPTTGVLVEVKLEEFSTSSKNKVRVSVVSSSVAEALRFTSVSSVYPSLAIEVVSSDLSWARDVGSAGADVEVRRLKVVPSGHILGTFYPGI